MTLLPEAGLLGDEIKQFLSMREAGAAQPFAQGSGDGVGALGSTIAHNSISVDELLS
jgi:hypothetical protein